MRRRVVITLRRHDILGARVPRLLQPAAGVQRPAPCIRCKRALHGHRTCNALTRLAIAPAPGAPFTSSAGNNAALGLPLATPIDRSAVTEPRLAADMKTLEGEERGAGRAVG